MEKIIKTAMGVGNTAMGMENTGTYPIRDTEKLASAINNLANAIDRLNEQPEEEYHYFNGNEPIKDKEIIGFMEGLPERVWEDTPEEWEEEQRNLIEKAQRKYHDFRKQEMIYSTDIESYRKTREYVEIELVEDIVNFTKQLLEERERETLEDMTNWVVEYYKDKWQIRDFDAEIAIQKLVEKKVSKLKQ